MVKKAKKYPENEAVNDENPFFEVVMTKSYVNGSFMGYLVIIILQRGEILEELLGAVQEYILLRVFV
ncbi:hypothetical protein TSUD_367490 [Trifolium subterraneum]|uniref:Uncharacterized protein n=1 Tax=Trifolium subterraneum TaxID=3900 RepID=A0A2Z6NAX7_TRISU|nr:hypothetical protein TSUD_367490 [Trifolium subterraneum]